jgi:hypothetical protein
MRLNPFRLRNIGNTWKSGAFMKGSGSPGPSGLARWTEILEIIGHAAAEIVKSPHAGITAIGHHRSTPTAGAGTSAP